MRDASLSDCKKAGKSFGEASYEGRPLRLGVDKNALGVVQDFSFRDRFVPRREANCQKLKISINLSKSTECLCLNVARIR